MIKQRMHDILTLLGDSQEFAEHSDRLTQVIQDTLGMVNEEELSDDELEWVAAARKDGNAEMRNRFEQKKRKS